jgi:hypothetical protein
MPGQWAAYYNPETWARPMRNYPGEQWINDCLKDPERCKVNFRMEPQDLLHLHDVLIRHHGLRPTRIGSLERMCIFLWVCGHGASTREAYDRFERALGTVSGTVTDLVDVMYRFATTKIYSRQDMATGCHADLLPFRPYFDGVCGAIDGTHIELQVPANDKDDHFNRKSRVTTNVLCIVDMDQRFTFVGAGMVGACHDMKVLTTARSMQGFPEPPTGRQLRP